VRLGGEDLSREVRYRTHDEGVAAAQQTPPIALVRVGELGVPTRRAEGHVVVIRRAGRIDHRCHPRTVSRVGESTHRPKVNADLAEDLDGEYGGGRGPVGDLRGRSDQPGRRSPSAEGSGGATA